MMKTGVRFPVATASGVLMLLVAASLVSVRNRVTALDSSPTESARTRLEATRLIGKYHSATLSADQERVEREALSAMPAPCCAGYSMATCCCSCNLAKSAWGLAHSLIAEKGYDAPQVRAEVKRWVDSINPNGYAGDACHSGRCDRPFHEDGCGGMNERQVM